MSEDPFHMKNDKQGEYSSSGTGEFVASITKNLKSDVVYTNRDKLKLVFLTYESALKDKYGWTAPFGIFSAVVLTLLTTDKFNSFLGIQPDIWKAIVILCTVGSGVWLLFAGIKSWRNKKSTIEHAITQIMTPDSHKQP